jgi:hypothetical protein
LTVFTDNVPEEKRQLQLSSEGVNCAFGLDPTDLSPLSHPRDILSISAKLVELGRVGEQMMNFHYLFHHDKNPSTTVSHAALRKRALPSWPRGGAEIRPFLY